MSKVTRTTGPLHFEDLEPHRFEDLVRQLIYDFRQWVNLEPTGRLGADEGIDIRGVEAFPETNEEVEEVTDDSDRLPQQISERLWTIQCKRGKAITPKRMRVVVDRAIPRGSEPPHGFILSAACDFSATARRVFREETRARGVRDSYLWGKADLEDMLFRPDNDHLLFAYFGISLQVRRRSLRSKIRSTLATKRKATAALGGVERTHFKTVLVRDATDRHYPHKEAIPDFARRPRWKLYTFVQHHPHGLLLLVRRFFAYVADSGAKWDSYDKFDDSRPPVTGHPAGEDEEENVYRAERWRIHDFWMTIPEENRATFETIRLIRYEDIIDIDKDGDIWPRDVPHIFVEFHPRDGPFAAGIGWDYLKWGSGYSEEQSEPDPTKRIRFFPDEIPDVKPEGQS